MWKKIFATGCVCLIACLAQATDPYGYKSETEGNLQFWLGIATENVTADGSKLSGTKIGTAVVCYATTPSGGGGGPTFQDFW